MCFLFMAASGNGHHGHTARKGHDFYIMAGGRFDHGEASSLCRRAGGRLPVIDSSETDRRVVEILANSGVGGGLRAYLGCRKSGGDDSLWRCDGSDAYFNDRTGERKGYWSKYEKR